MCEDDVYHIEWRWPCSGDPVPGLLPGSGQHGTHPHPHPRLYLLLQPGGKHTAPSEKAKINKKAEPINIEEEPEEETTFPKAERWIYCWPGHYQSGNGHFSVWIMWNSFKTENRLRIHIVKAHKVLKALPSHEMVRNNPQDTSLVMSPVRDARKEEYKKEEFE